MEIERIDGYTDPRFSPEVLRQHGAFLADGQPWSFRIVSDREAVVSVPDGNLAGLEEAAACFRFYAEHITAFYDEAGQCLLLLPEVARREVEISSPPSSPWTRRSARPWAASSAAARIW